MDVKVGIEPTIKLLQSLALPLGYSTLPFYATLNLERAHITYAMVSTHVHSLIATLAIFPLTVVLAWANVLITLMQAIIIIIVAAHNLIVVPLHRIEVGKVIQTGAVTCPATLPAVIGLRVIRLLRGGAAAAARRILTSGARVGGLRVVVGFTHRYNITLKRWFVKRFLGYS